MTTSKALIKLHETYSNAKFVFTTKPKEILNSLQVRQIMEIYFIKLGGKNIQLSIEDQRFVTKFSENIQQQDDGHYVMPLPLKSNQIALPNNGPLAVNPILLNLFQAIDSSTAGLQKPNKLTIYYSKNT